MNPGPDFYDRVHGESNDAETDRLYGPLFRTVVDPVQDRQWTSILKVGSGSVFLAEMILRCRDIRYFRFDFSPAAINKCADFIMMRGMHGGLKHIDDLGVIGSIVGNCDGPA